jgi:HlyD family secretion protein
VGNVELGQDVDFTVDAYPYRTFHGKVVQNRNAAITVQSVVTYDVVISVSNDDLKLKPGMTATVSIIIAHRDDALKIPNAALRFRMPESQTTPSPVATGTPPPSKHPGSGGRALRRDRSIYVMPPGGGKPAPVPVKLGINDGVATEVTEGLKEGDIVVTGTATPQAGPGSAAPNPFGGGPRRF